MSDMVVIRWENSSQGSKKNEQHPKMLPIANDIWCFKSFTFYDFGMWILDFEIYEF
jgi:hypothetical protein